MFVPNMVLPPDALIGVPAVPATTILGDMIPVGPLTLLPIGLAMVLYGILLFAREATRRFEEHRRDKREAVEAEHDVAHSRAA